MRLAVSASLVAVACLAACASGKPLPGDNEPTLASLAKREVPVDKQRPVQGSPAQAIAAYGKFLDSTPVATLAPQRGSGVSAQRGSGVSAQRGSGVSAQRGSGVSAQRESGVSAQRGSGVSAQRAEAMRRLGDLEMDAADARDAGSASGAAPDYKAAVARYEAYLAAHPSDAGNDRVLYQLARAQEQSGALEAALKTLDRLVASYPGTEVREEAQFRRGEAMFTLGAYAAAETAYDAVLAPNGTTALRDRALYMQGWARFKQGKLEDGLRSFFGVLDGKLAHRGDESLEALRSLSRGDRELVEDTLRVMSLSLSNLQGAQSVGAYIDSDVRRAYEFRVYQQLGELYIKQERVKDAADAFGLFVRKNPMHAQAPVLQARVIDIYESGGFANLALEAKKQYVGRYGVASEFRKANPEGWSKAEPLVKTRLSELARHYHAHAQKTRATSDYQEAVRWYRDLITGFPGEPDTAKNHFLLGELLYEDGRFAQAAVEYEKTAYAYPRHDKSADAGYAALLAHAEIDKRAAAADKSALQLAGVASALRFAQAFAKDPRAAAVLTNAAERLYAQGDVAQAQRVAERVLALDPPATAQHKRVATTVLAHTAFESGAFDRAEKRYGELLALTPDSDKARAELVERQAAAIYKQGEAARKAGDSNGAVGHFTRVAAVAPGSAIHASAQYDAAAALIGSKDWGGAASTLEDFRRRFPKHALVDDASSLLAAAYLEQGRWSDAAGEFERVASSGKDPKLAQQALWQAAELHAKGDHRAAAARAYERYLKLYPQPFERAMQTRHRLATFAKADGNAQRELEWQREIFDADQRGGAARTESTRYLGAMAALALAQPAVDDYKKVALVEPLQRSLKTKKQKFEEALKGFAAAAEYGVADASTAATFHTAALYQDFGKAMLNSQRPKGLKKLELEQYNVLLEEQAFPFEDKAIELHEVNARRAAQSVYDEWVQQSFAALRALKPGRYARTERVEGAVHEPVVTEAAIAALEQAVKANPTQPASFNQLGVGWRHRGEFAKARAAYEQALALDATYAPAHLNLGVLLDLYVGDAALALTHYERFLALSPAGDAAVGKWVAELKTRKPVNVAQADVKPAKKE